MSVGGGEPGALGTNVPALPAASLPTRLTDAACCPFLCRLVRLLDKYNLGNGTRWLENWQKVWDENLSRCKNGKCLVKLS